MDKKEKKEKKCVTFWVEKDLLETFDELYYTKSYFIRECLKKAIEDSGFYIEVTTGKKVE